ncbi:hypothetical protein AgCh_039778 [Apium graveolens]
MSRVYYFLLLVTLIFQHFTILSAIPLPHASGPSLNAPSPTPTYMPSSPSPTPSHDNKRDSPPSPSPRSAKSKGSSKGMSGGQKAGLAFGVIAGAALLGFGGMVYAKRRKNIRRSRNIGSVQLGSAFVRRPSP